MQFAYVQAKAFFFHLLAARRIVIADGYETTFQIFPIPRPKDGLRVRLPRAWHHCVKSVPRATSAAARSGRWTRARAPHAAAGRAAARARSRRARAARRGGAGSGSASASTLHPAATGACMWSGARPRRRNRAG